MGVINTLGYKGERMDPLILGQPFGEGHMGTATGQTSRHERVILGRKSVTETLITRTLESTFGNQPNGY